MSPDNVVFRLDRTRRLAFGCILPALLLAAIGLFAGFAGVLLTNRLEPLGLVAVVGSLVLFGSFGLLLLIVTIQEVPRALRDSPVVVVGPRGIELTGVGLLLWSDIERVCVERRIGRALGGSRDAVGSGRRLSIWPKNESIARRRPLGALSAGVARSFGLAPLGVYGYELERPLDELLDLVREHLPVEDCR